MTSLTAALAELVATVGARLPLPVEGCIAAHCLLDWTATVLAGVDEESVTMLHRLIEMEGGTAEAPLIGFGTRATARQSALLNGTASHALDLDDVHLESRVHPSCVVWPVIVALAGRCRSTGADAASAFVAGVEMQSRLGRLIGNPHYGIGWHNTATLGTFGATSAAARLLGLDSVQHRHALGIAATMAAGLRASFGTMAKPLHAGRAAETGIQAALLASMGFKASLDDPLLAYARITSGGEPGPEQIASCIDPARPTAITKVIFKYSASCYGTHAPIEAASRLPTQPEAEDSILIEIEPQYMSVCNIARPQDATQARFSIRSCAALRLLGYDMLSDASYRAAADDSGAVARLRERIEVRAAEDLSRASARLTLNRPGMDPVVVLADASRPESDLDRQEKRLHHKASRISKERLGDEQVRTILDLQALPSFDRYLEMFAA